MPNGWHGLIQSKYVQENATLEQPTHGLVFKKRFGRNAQLLARMVLVIVVTYLCQFAVIFGNGVKMSYEH